MAVVMEWTTPAGVKIKFCDDAYRDCSAEELKRREEDIRRTAYWCAARAEERRRAREQARTT